MQDHINERTLKRLVAPEDAAQLRVWDLKDQGFGVIVGQRSKTFVLNLWRGGKPQTEKIGTWPEMSCAQARQEARKLRGAIADEKPTPLDLLRLAQTGPTLREAIEGYIKHLVNSGKQEASVKKSRTELLKHLAGWLERPLRSITPLECRTRHEELAVKRGIRSGGKHVANRVMRNFSTVWKNYSREARLTQQAWPANPAEVVNYFTADQPGFVRRRRQPMKWSSLPSWRKSVDALRSSQRRIFNLLVLLTAVRRTDALTIRREHVNLTQFPIEVRVWNQNTCAFDVHELPPESMFRPFPKGGSTKAFDVVLPRFLVRLLSEHLAQRTTDDGGWLFYAKLQKTRRCIDCAKLGFPEHVKGAVGHMSDPSEGKGKDGPACGDASPHRLRDTYATAGDQAGVSLLDIGILLNHATGNVTAGYIRADVEHLRTCQEKIAAFLLARMQPDVKNHPASGLRQVAGSVIRPDFDQLRACQQQIAAFLLPRSGTRSFMSAVEPAPGRGG